jgi:hypothetical protein
LRKVAFAERGLRTALRIRNGKRASVRKASCVSPTSIASQDHHDLIDRVHFTAMSHYPDPFEQKLTILAYVAPTHSGVKWEEMIVRKRTEAGKHGYSLWWIPYSTKFIECVRARAHALGDSRIPVFVVGPSATSKDPVTDVSSGTHVHWLDKKSEVLPDLVVRGKWKVRPGTDSDGAGSALVLENVSFVKNEEDRFRKLLSSRKGLAKAGDSAQIMESEREGFEISVSGKRSLVAIGWLRPPEFVVEIDMIKVQVRDALPSGTDRPHP